MPARDPFEVDLLMSLSSGTVAKMLRLVHEDLDNSQPGCRHMRLIQVALRIKFVPSVTDEGRMPSCKAEVSDLPAGPLRLLDLLFTSCLDLGTMRRLSFIEHRVMMLECMLIFGFWNMFFLVRYREKA